METVRLIEHMRRVGAEPTDVEVKSAAGGLPTTVVETISAFANGTGGTLLLGLEEARNFAPAAGFEALRIRDALADACANKVEPPCRAPIEIEELEGAQIVRVDVPELDPVDKPCFVVSQHTYGGSYIRGGDGDRRLNHYEVTQLLSNRTQPVYDRAVVPDATSYDLDPKLVQDYLDRARRRSPGLDTIPDDQLLVRLCVLGHDDSGASRPTLAGLLSLGVYPQQFFPQLFVAGVALPSLRMGETSPDGRRFLDNVSLTGPIPTIVQGVVAFAIRNMRVGAIIRSVGREDRYDYPLDVIRELVVNALMHRDYSPDACGTHVQVEIYPDRLVVKSAGGLYGSITVADLGSDESASTTRNRALASILADVTLPGSRGEAVCENRGSGLLAVLAELRRVGMSPPEYKVGPGQVLVKVPQHALLAPDVVEWIGTLSQAGLNNDQHLALAMMRNTGYVTNAMLQAWGVDRMAAGQALRNLVVRGLALRTGGRRYATYRLLDQLPDQLPLIPGSTTRTIGDRPARQPGSGVETELQAIVQAIRAGRATVRELREQVALPERTLYRRIGELMVRRVIEPTEPRGSSRQSYRLTKREEQ